MKRAACYVRVSTQEQKNHGLSVDSQIAALKEYCNAHGYEITDIYNDAGISASKSYKHRPALLKMIQDCQRGKIDIILMTKLDRFFRSVPDYYAVMEQIGKDVPWRAIWEDYETETSAGIFKVNIMLSVAQAESDRTSERIKAVNEYKRAQGKFVGGKAPIGYRMCKSDLLKDENTKEIVQEMFDFYATTYSTINAVRLAHEKGLMVARETFTRMLKNETYCGNAHGYACEPYITREQFLRNKQSVDDRRQRNSPYPGRHYFYAGIIKCMECGKNMSGSVRWMSSGKNRRAYKFYRCIGFRNALCDHNRTISESVIEEYLLSHIEDALNEYIVKINSIEGVEDNNKKICRIKAKLARIGDRYEEGDLSKDEYKTKRALLLNELETLQNITPFKAPEPLPENWREVYDSLTDEDKKSFWHATVRRVEISNDLEPKFNIFF